MAGNKGATDMSLAKSKVALAVAGIMALGLAGQAQAGAYATSTVLIDNFKISLINNQNIIINSFLFTATNTADLGNPAVVTNLSCGGAFLADDCGPSGSVLNPAPANATGSTVLRTDNTFLFYGPGAQTYSNSDSVIYTSELTDPLTDVTKTQQIAESEVQSTGTGAANATIKSQTGFEINFEITGDTAETLTLAFEATPYMRAFISALNFANGNAQGSLNASFTLTNDASGETINWAPQGSPSTNNCAVDEGGDLQAAGVTCAEDNDDVDLNRQVGVSSNGANNPFNPGLGLFGITIGNLYAGDWTLSLNTVTETQVRLETVPEPGVLALVGLGLAGLGWTRSRRKQA
jgi:hypothetical protein